MRNMETILAVPSSYGSVKKSPNKHKRFWLSFSAERTTFANSLLILFILVVVVVIVIVIFILNTTTTAATAATAAYTNTNHTIHTSNNTNSSKFNISCFWVFFFLSVF
jgi:hypothetical protein